MKPRRISDHCSSSRTLCQAGDTWAGEGGDAKEGADVISYLKSLHEGQDERNICQICGMVLLKLQLLLCVT